MTCFSPLCQLSRLLQIMIKFPIFPCTFVILLSPTPEAGINCPILTCPFPIRVLSTSFTWLSPYALCVLLLRFFYISIGSCKYYFYLFIPACSSHFRSLLKSSSPFFTSPHFSWSATHLTPPSVWTREHSSFLPPSSITHIRHQRHSLLHGTCPSSRGEYWISMIEESSNTCDIETRVSTQLLLPLLLLMHYILLFFFFFFNIFFFFSKLVL